MVENTYYTLLASLPHISSLFDSKITPVSRIQLNRRLSMLNHDDRQMLSAIEELMHWSRLESTIDEASLIRRTARLFQSLPGQDLKQLIAWRLDMRTLIAALRRKRAGEKAPAYEQWSFGSRYPYIRRQWAHTALGLQHSFPWVAEASVLLQHRKHGELERLLLKVIWDYLCQFGLKHSFDFEAVVLYVLRWNLVARWTSYNPDLALEKFNQISHQILSEAGMDAVFKQSTLLSEPEASL
ncbi:hypothetical protein EOPP23_05190 [Endozoicomonas sp. OPT23]|uniref:hypothetical protein n=1 Tax=Endozoicomonas sp. OPT23 TaxID=2072845 RepID=UPI00129AFACA|nr:hypothetical protein [Endozoicomonas sp. OPT23]MRI32377.1 hypothetical protein [Endozoicomonas sp. OPT23]